MNEFEAAILLGQLPGVKERLQRVTGMQPTNFQT